MFTIHHAGRAVPGKCGDPDVLAIEQDATTAPGIVQLLGDALGGLFGLGIVLECLNRGRAASFPEHLENVVADKFYVPDAVGLDGFKMEFILPDWKVEAFHFGIPSVVKLRVVFINLVQGCMYLSGLIAK